MSVYQEERQHDTPRGLQMRVKPAPNDTMTCPYSSYGQSSVSTVLRGWHCVNQACFVAERHFVSAARNIEPFDGIGVLILLCQVVRRVGRLRACRVGLEVASGLQSRSTVVTGLRTHRISYNSCAFACRKPSAAVFRATLYLKNCGDSVMMMRSRRARGEVCECAAGRRERERASKRAVERWSPGCWLVPKAPLAPVAYLRQTVKRLTKFALSASAAPPSVFGLRLDCGVARQYEVRKGAKGAVLPQEDFRPVGTMVTEICAVLYGLDLLRVPTVCIDRALRATWPCRSCGPCITPKLMA